MPNPGHRELLAIRAEILAVVLGDAKIIMWRLLRRFAAPAIPLPLQKITEAAIFKAGPRIAKAVLGMVRRTTWFVIARTVAMSKYCKKDYK